MVQIIQQLKALSYQSDVRLRQTLTKGFHDSYKFRFVFTSGARSREKVSGGNRLVKEEREKVTRASI